MGLFLMRGRKRKGEEVMASDMEGGWKGVDMGMGPLARPWSGLGGGMGSLNGPLRFIWGN